LYAYLRENWGAPFIIAFMLLLIVSATELSIGQTESANGVAVYAFYALVAGVALQIASYVKYGESEPSPGVTKPEPSAPPPFKWPGRRTMAAAGIVAALIAGGALVAFFYPALVPQVSTQTNLETTVITSTAGPSTFVTTSTSTIAVTYTRQCAGCQPLTIQHTTATSLNEPGGVILEGFILVVTGGSQPYSYNVRWGDGFIQTGTDSVYTRTIQANGTLVTSATVTVTSSDHQQATLTLKIPPP